MLINEIKYQPDLKCKKKHRDNISNLCGEADKKYIDKREGMAYSSSATSTKGKHVTERQVIFNM